MNYSYTDLADYADKLWYNALDILRTESNVQDGRDQPTHELLLASLYLTNSRNRFVESREIDLAFAFVEFFWHLSGRRDLKFLNSWNKRMKNFSDDGKILHGAYGYRLYGDGIHEVNQIENAYYSLRDNPNSRQVVLQIWNSSTDLPAYDGSPSSKDIPCNITSHLLIRDGKLYWHQNQRSQDLIWGFPYDVIHWTMIQEIFAGWLGIDVGTYKLSADSLHVYERHWDYIEGIEKEFNYSNDEDLRLPYEESQKVIKYCERIIENIAEASTHDSLLEAMDDILRLPKAYQNVMVVIAAERMYKFGLLQNSLGIIEHCTNSRYRTIWRRYFLYREEMKHMKPIAEKDEK